MLTEGDGNMGGRRLREQPRPMSHLTLRRIKWLLPKLPSLLLQW